MTFSSSAYLLAGFLTIYSLIFLWISYREQRSGLFSAKTGLFVFGISYLVIAHFSVLTGLAYSIEQTNLAPCENIVNTSTYNGTTTTYTHIDSCYNRVVPEAIQQLYVAFNYILYLGILVAILGVMFLGLKKVLFEW